MNEAPTIPETLDDPALIEADVRSVMDHFISGSPLDPSVESRVQVRAERITSAVFQRLGQFDKGVNLIRELGGVNSNSGTTFDFDPPTAILAMAAMQWEIEKLREERALYLDAFYVAKDASQSAEPLPTFEELMRTTSTKINCLLDGKQ